MAFTNARWLGVVVQTIVNAAPFWGPAYQKCSIENTKPGFVFWMVDTRGWYFRRVFLMIIPFRGYQKISLCDLDLSIWYVKLIRYQFWCTRCAFRLLKNLKTLSLTIWMVGSKSLVFYMSIPCDKTYPWIPKDLTSTLVFDVQIENFNLSYI
jgi:hypothetical protein